MREYLIRFQMLLFNLYALAYSPLPLPTLSSSIISAGAQRILQSYLKGLCLCCVKTHNSWDPCGDSFLQIMPQQQRHDTANSLPAMPCRSHRLTPAMVSRSTPVPFVAENQGVVAAQTRRGQALVVGRQVSRGHSLWQLHHLPP